MTSRTAGVLEWDVGITNILDRIKRRYSRPLTPNERLLALIGACGRDGILWRWSARLLSVYPDDVPAALHETVPLWRRTVSRVGVWVDIIDETFAYRRYAKHGWTGGK